MSDVFYEDYQIHCEVGGPELKSDTNSESENDELGSDIEDEYEDEDLQGYVDFPNERRKNGLSRLLEVFPDVDSGFLKDKNVEFDGDLSKINDWIQEVFEKDLARNFPPKVSKEFLEKVNYLMEIFPNMSKDFIKNKVKDLMGKTNLVQLFLEEVLQTDFKKDFFNITEFLQYRQIDAKEGRKIVGGEKLLQIQKNCGIEGLEICPFCAFAYMPPQPMMHGPGSLHDRTFYCQNGPSCGITSCRICKKEKPDSCGCNPSSQSNTQWEWQQRLIEDSATQNEKTPTQDGAASSNTFAPAGTNIWGNLNLSSMYEFSASGTRIVCQKCKIDMNEIFKSSKKHACELECKDWDQVSACAVNVSITETETEGAVGGQGTLASNTKNGEFEPAPEFFDAPLTPQIRWAKRQEFFAELSDEEEFFEASASKSKAASYQARKKPLDVIFDGVMAIYPELDCMQLYSMLRKIKKENNNTLKDLSMIQVLDKVAELKAQESLEKKENAAQSVLNSDNDPLEVSAPLSAPAPETAPVLLGATPKFQLATQEKGNNEEKWDDSTPKKAQELLEVGKNNAQTSENDPLVFPPTFLPSSAPKTAPVLLGATPKIQSATQEKGSNKEKMDVYSPKKVRLNSKLEAKNGKTPNVKFSFKVKFNSDQAALNMKTAINKALTGVKTNADSNEN